MVRLKSFAPVVLLFCALVTALFSLYGDDSYSKMQALRRSLAAQRQTNRELRSSVEALRQQVHGIKNDPRALEKAARNELGLAHPSEVVFIFENLNESEQDEAGQIFEGGE